MNKLYINNDGKILYCENVPEEPKFDLTEFDYMNYYNRRDYKSALELAKDNGVKFEDQRSSFRILKSIPDLKFVRQEEIDFMLIDMKGKFFDLPSGVSVEVKGIGEECGHPCNDYKDYCQYHGCKNFRKIAILKPLSDNSAHSKDEEIIDTIKNINNQISDLTDRRKMLARSLGVRKCKECGTYNLHYVESGWCCAFC